MRKVEAVRVREGMTKTKLAAELKTSVGTLRKRTNGRSDRAEGDGNQDQGFSKERKISLTPLGDSSFDLRPAVVADRGIVGLQS